MDGKCEDRPPSAKRQAGPPIDRTPPTPAQVAEAYEIIHGRDKRGDPDTDPPDGWADAIAND